MVTVTVMVVIVAMAVMVVIVVWRYLSHSRAARIGVPVPHE